ncbi:MAG: glutamate--tRNA ligase [Alphaproteobacteria bacterium]
MTSPIITRFAPSPTGFLHIGGARTAYFNWLFARQHKGTFLLRIEDTDRARSTEAATAAILEGLQWMGLEWDGEAVSQFARRDRHAEVARQLLAEGKAYYCYASQQELEEMREAAKARGEQPRYDGRWRERDASEAPAGILPVIRLKAPQIGETTVDDCVQGQVVVQNSTLDDMILLRSDGTPTYLLSVVVDDYDSGITHVIRGDDHFTNTFRQIQIYQAMGWKTPIFAHIPLLHGADGAKLSKRHGALGIEAYRDMGYLPEALNNYLLRLGWGHGDHEIISREQALELFSLEGIGRSPARIDMKKLDSLNAHYIKEKPAAELALLLKPFLAAQGMEATWPLALIELLKPRVHTLPQMVEQGAFFNQLQGFVYDEKQQAIIKHAEALLPEIVARLEKLPEFTAIAVEAMVKEMVTEKAIKLSDIAQPLRLALMGTLASPPLFMVMELLGQAECLRRLKIL